jgi:phospholipid N-methyltransferase
MNKNDLLISFEINRALNLELKNKIKKQNVIFIKDDVKKMQKYLEKNGIKKVDYIISSLPLAQMSKKEVIKILNIVKKSIKDKGVYMQYQYSPQSARLLKKTFKKTEIKFMPLNFPPAFVYTCIKK